MNTILRAALAALLAMAQPLSAEGAAEPGSARRQPAPDPLETIDAMFRQAYAKVRARNLMLGDPALVLTGGRVLLFRGRAQAGDEPLVPPLYHRLKAVAHVPLALHLLLGGPDPVPARELATLRNLAAQARERLGDAFPALDQPRQERILDASLTLMGEWPAGDGRARLERFTRELGPLLLENAQEAAGLELDQLHRAVCRFREQLGPDDWARLRVVICGSHMARDGEVSLQYFCRLLNQSGEGGRIVFAEGQRDPQEALGLLATHRVDAGVGAAFFGDPARMHRDLLADGARRWLDEHRLDSMAP